jgi:hypothetical protein
MKRGCRRFSSLVALLCVSTGAFSEELTLRCKFGGSARPGSEREKEVNQIFIDTELPAVGRPIRAAIRRIRAAYVCQSLQTVEER